MENGEIGRLRPSHFDTPQAHSQPQAVRVEDHQRKRRARADSVELTTPHRAALRLLRERILENTRLALDLPRRSAERFHFAQMPAKKPSDTLDRLLSDQSILASERRRVWPTDRIDEALELGLVQGTADTMQILFELDELDVVVWQLVSAVIDEYYRRLK